MQHKNLTFLDALAGEYESRKETARQFGKEYTADETFLWALGKFSKYLKEFHNFSKSKCCDGVIFYQSDMGEQAFCRSCGKSCELK